DSGIITAGDWAGAACNREERLRTFIVSSAFTAKTRGCLGGFAGQGSRRLEMIWPLKIPHFANSGKNPLAADECWSTLKIQNLTADPRHAGAGDTDDTDQHRSDLSEHNALSFLSS